jgi:hypothetical protein
MISARWLVSLALVGVLTAGCQSATPEGLAPVTATPAAFPTVVKPSLAISRTLQCIRETGVVRGKTIAVGPWVDSTGKINAVSAGSTGAFLPQAGSATFVTAALKDAGATVLVAYFGPAEHKLTADYVVNGLFNTLDFGATTSADLRVVGVGPIGQTGWAQLTLTVQMDIATTRINRQISVVQRPVRYTQIGAGVGRTVGDFLITGGVSVADQQRLQFEAVNGPIAIGVIDVLLKEFPAASHCGDYLAETTHGLPSSRSMTGRETTAWTAAVSGEQD